MTYNELIKMVFRALNKKIRFIHVPLWIFRFMLLILRILPRYRHWNYAMVERMNEHLVFDHEEATNDFSFMPGQFILTESDLSKL